MIDIENGVKELIHKAEILAKELFESPTKMKEFLVTLSKVYNTSYNNILLLKDKKKDISFIADKETMKKYGFHVQENEEPLEVIKRIKVDNEIKFKIDKVYDISQTDAVKSQEKTYSQEYIEIILKGMCVRRGLIFETNNLMINLENIVIDISNNTRSNNNISMVDIDKCASQSQIEVDATVFSIAKKLNINTRNYNLKAICEWGIDKDTRTIKESLKYIQKFTNYFIRDFHTQEKLYNIEQEEQEEIE